MQFFAHHFFVEHDTDHMTAEGCRKMRDELRDIFAFFQNVDKKLDEDWHAAWESLGIKPDWWEKVVERYKKRARVGGG